MSRHSLRTWTLAAPLALALLAGCETTSLKGDTAAAGGAPVETRSPVAVTPPGGAAAAGVGAGGAGAGSALPQSQVATVDLARPGGADAALPAQRVVYFDFDSYVIKDEYKGLIDAFAKALTAQRDKRLVVEGHTDERGGREYNLALGQKRAEAVVKSLNLLGVDEKRLEAVSFGEERPAAQGSDEGAWSRNRRAELKEK